MTGLETTAYGDLITLLQATWPGLTAVFREEQLPMINLENRLEAGSLVAPFAVIAAGTSEPEGWGLDNFAYRWRVTVRLVVSTADANAATPSGGLDVTAYLLQQCGLVRQALVAFAGGSFQLAGEWPSVQVGDGLEANRAFISAETSLRAGEVTFGMLVGEIANS